jgi:hypothetical protein
VKPRTDLSKLNDDEYRAYKRVYNAKRQRKYRRKMKKLGIDISSNMSINQRREARK